MRRSRVAVGWRRIAIVAAKFFLNPYRADRRVHLNLLMESVVISPAEVIDKIKRPLAAIAQERTEPRIEPQHLTRADLQQGTVGLQSLEFGFILDARQLKPVNLRI